MYPTAPSNLTDGEIVALKWLKNNNELGLKPADKGGNIVIMKKSDYHNEAMRQLMDVETYVKLQKDPINGCQNALRTLLQLKQL